MCHQIIVDPERGVISISSEDQVVIITIVKDTSRLVQVTNATAKIVHYDHMTIHLFEQWSI